MSDGRLTKTAIKSELTRRIEWFEKSYEWTSETTPHGFENSNCYAAIAFGRYRALLEMRWQIDSGLFKGGFAA